MKRDREVCWKCGLRYMVRKPETQADWERVRAAHDQLCDQGIWSCPRLINGGRTVHYDVSDGEVPDDCPYTAEHAVNQ